MPNIQIELNIKYDVFVKLGSSKGSLVEGNGSELTVFLREKAVDGAANDALTKVLAKYFDVPKSSVRILRGLKSRHKLVGVVA